MCVQYTYAHTCWWVRPWRGNAHTCGCADDDDANHVRVPIKERKRAGARHPYAPHRRVVGFSPICHHRRVACVARTFRTAETAAAVAESTTGGQPMTGGQQQQQQLTTAVVLMCFFSRGERRVTVIII